MTLDDRATGIPAETRAGQLPHKRLFARPMRIVRVHYGVVQSFLSFAGGLLIWELVGRLVLTNRLFFVPFSEMIERMYELARDGELQEHIWISGQEFVLGFIAAVIGGIIIGVTLGLSRTARTYVGPWVDVFNATPVIALAPIFVLVWGLGLESKIALIGFVTVWPVILNTQAGMLAADPNIVEAVRSFGASPMQVFRFVRLPYAVAFIAVGLRLGVGRAVVGVVIGELFGSRAGLGFLLFVARERFDTAAIYVSMFILATFAVVSVWLLQQLEYRLAPWRKADPARQGDM